MRSDWDPAHGKKPDLQKRYPDIEAREWEYLLRLAVDDFDFTMPDARQRWQAALIRKIKARLGETGSHD